MKAMTLGDFVLMHEGSPTAATRELSRLLLDVASCCNEIASMVSNASVRGLAGAADSTNVHGETQVPLDLAANQVLMERLQLSHHLGLFLSEESDDVIETRHCNAGSRYAIAVDPLDGSKLIDDAGTVGTIFAVFRTRKRAVTPTRDDFLQPGRSLAAAGIAVYGAQTMLAYTTGHGVHLFAYDHFRREWVLVNEQLRMQEPQSFAVYSVNEGNSLKWRPEVQSFITELKSSAEPRFSQRYAGSLVADGLRVLRSGGVFLYPDEATSPRGKLRLVYECAPLAFLVEQSGGQAVNTAGDPILDVVPRDIHERSPLVIGHPSHVNRFLRSLGRSV
jgi:fructose-1,6-bisphosphatase I